MIFYLAVDSNGQTKILGTQADANKVNRDFSQIDIPTDKAGLMAWVQQMLDETINAMPAVTAPTPTEDSVEAVSEILYEMLGLGGGDGDTIREYAEKIAALVPEAKPEIISIATADMRDDKDGAPSISHTIPVKPAPAPMSPGLSKILTVEYIQNWLIETADQREIERIYNAIGCRVGEIVRGARD